MQQKMIRSALLDVANEGLSEAPAVALLGDRITALPLKEISAVELRAPPGSGAPR